MTNEKRFKSVIEVKETTVTSYEIYYDGPCDRLGQLAEDYAEAVRNYDTKAFGHKHPDVTVELADDLSRTVAAVPVDREETEPEYWFGLDSQQGLPKDDDKYHTPIEWVLWRYRKGHAMQSGEIIDRSPWYDDDMERTLREHNEMLIRNGLGHEVAR